MDSSPNWIRISLSSNLVRIGFKLLNLNHSPIRLGCQSPSYIGTLSSLSAKRRGGARKVAPLFLCTLEREGMPNVGAPSPLRFSFYLDKDNLRVCFWMEFGMAKSWRGRMVHMFLHEFLWKNHMGRPIFRLLHWGVVSLQIWIQFKLDEIYPIFCLSWTL